MFSDVGQGIPVAERKSFGGYVQDVVVAFNELTAIKTCYKNTLINNPTVSHFAGRNNGLVLIDVFAGDVSGFADMKYNSGHGRSGSPGLAVER